MVTRSLSIVSDAIVHHSAGPRNQTALQIDAEHRLRKPPFAMIGYHYVVGEDGTIWAGRSLDVVPAAAFGRNAQSVDICFPGNFQSNDSGFCGDPTPAQIASGQELLLWLHVKLPIVRTIGHGDIAPLFYPENKGDYSTDCPGDRLEAMIPELRAYVLAHLNDL
jgi:N-acetyl-anhydromuramyl-L-alanine amidase AmpD